MLNIDGIKGGMWIPEDGVGDPYEICHSLMKEAKNLGNYISSKSLSKYLHQFKITNNKIS